MAVRKGGVSVFIPCYNEGERISHNARSCLQALRKLKRDFELVLVDDSSTDDTLSCMQTVAKKSAHVRVLAFKNGPSRRENLGKAMKTAKYDIVAFMDADLATDLKHLPQLMNSIERYDIAIGSRYLPRSKVFREPLRRIYSFFYNTSLKILFFSQIEDHQCGFKAFKKSVLLRLLEEMGYDKKFMRGWFWDAELLIRAQWHGSKLKKIPVVWRRGDQSSFSLNREIKVIPYIIGLRLRTWW